jgi:hypothetical protein
MASIFPRRFRSNILPHLGHFYFGFRVERFSRQPVEFDMKAQRIIWPGLFLVTGLVCWRSNQIAPHGMMRPSLPLSSVWSNKYASGPYARTAVASDPGAAPSASTSPYDPYFIHVNDFRQVLIPASASQPEQREIDLIH